MTGEQRPACERVVLVGGMGAGKTAVGAALARRLGWRHIDLDACIEQAAGATVAALFRADGEAVFRRLEAEATAGIAPLREVVVSPGGGWLGNPALLPMLRPRALVVWLRASTATVLDRLARSDAALRPLLAAGDLAATLDRLMQAREPLYRQADTIVDVDALGVDEIARSLEYEVRRRASAAGPTG